MKNPQQVELTYNSISSTEHKLNICSKTFIIAYLLQKLQK